MVETRFGRKALQDVAVNLDGLRAYTRIIGCKCVCVRAGVCVCVCVSICTVVAALRERAKFCTEPELWAPSCSKGFRVITRGWASGGTSPGTSWSQILQINAYKPAMNSKLIIVDWGLGQALKGCRFHSWKRGRRNSDRTRERHLAADGNLTFNTFRGREGLGLKQPVVQRFHRVCTFVRRQQIDPNWLLNSLESIQATEVS